MSIQGYGEEKNHLNSMNVTEDRKITYIRIIQQKWENDITAKMKRKAIVFLALWICSDASVRHKRYCIHR